MATRISAYVCVDSASTIGSATTTVRTQLNACTERISKMLADPQADDDDRKKAAEVFKRINDIEISMRTW
jgi:hypothetical protein